MKHCEKCLYYEKCKDEMDEAPDDIFTFFPYNEDCPHFKNKADFVEVVRCRDCEYWHKKVFDDIYERYVGECHCPQWENDYFWYETTETVFCSNGKRKQE